MIGLIFLIVLFVAIYFLYPRGSFFRDPSDTPSEQDPFNSSDRNDYSRPWQLKRRQKEPNLSDAGRPEIHPVTTYHFESMHCEFCNARPLTQYQQGLDGLKLELCGHHARLKGKHLITNGFRIVVDVKDWNWK